MADVGTLGSALPGIARQVARDHEEHAAAAGPIPVCSGPVSKIIGSVGGRCGKPPRQCGETADGRRLT